MDAGDKTDTAVKGTAAHEHFETVIKVTAWIFGVTYGLGLLVSNFYLADFGIHDLSLFRAEYVLKGAAFLLYLALPLLVLIPSLLVSFFGVRFVSRRSKKGLTYIDRGFIVVLLMLIMLSVLGFLASLILALARGPVDVRQCWAPYASGNFLGFFAVFSASVILLWVSMRRQHFVKKVAFVTTGLLLLIVSIVWLAACYAEKVYPKLRPALGGGSAAVVDIDLSDEGRKTLESLGVVMNGNVIRETYVIYENDSCYFLGIMHGTDGSINSIRLPKSHVRGVRLPAPGFVGATGSDGSHKAPTTDPSLSTSQSSK